MGNAEKPKRDKVCDLCGDVGFAETIVTCFHCKKASEHIYCMQNQLYAIPDVWYCQGCPADAEISCSKAEKNEAPVERSTPLINKASEQTYRDEKQFNMTHKQLSTRRDSPKMLHSAKDERLSTVVSPGSDHGRYLTTETAKVTFLPTEVPLLKSGAKLRDVGTKFSSNLSLQKNCLANSTPPPSNGSLHQSYLSNFTPPPFNGLLQNYAENTICSSSTASLHRSYQTNTTSPTLSRTLNQKSQISAMPPPTPQKTCTSSKLVKALSRSKKKSVNAIVYASPSICIDNEHRVCDGKKVKTPDNKTSGIQKAALAASVKEGPLEGYVHAAENCSSTMCIKSMESACADSMLMHNNHREGNKEICTTSHSDSRLKDSSFQENELPLMLVINPDERLPHPYAPDVCWKGTFEVSDVLPQVHCGIQAHFPCKVSHKVYDILKEMPKILKLKILPRTEAWPRTFLIDPPTSNDIGLYFFPCEIERLAVKYIHLIEHIDSHDFAMQSYLGNVKLLIFTSKQLSKGSQRISGQLFLWCVFHQMKHKKKSTSLLSAASMQRISCTPLTFPLEGVSDEIDMDSGIVEANVMGRIDGVNT